MFFKKAVAAIGAVVMGLGLVFSGAQIESKAASDVSLTWNYIVYGNGAKSANAAYTGKISGTSGSVQLTAGQLTDGKLTGEGNCGKLVPASYDGVNFYYAKVPTSVNFTFRAKVKADQWWLSNGQEGFGVMVADKLGGKGWNNSYMVCASSNTYKWNGTEVDNTNGKSITQKLGIVTYAKSGVTSSNISAMESGDTETIQKYFKAESYPMDQRYPSSVNVVGNGINCPAEIDNPITEFYVTIQKNNTGYFITYESADGTYSLTKKYYDKNVLSQLDKSYVYVGFFTSRYAQATFSDVSFSSIDPSNDAPAEVQPVEKIPVKVSNYSLKYTGNTNYTVSFKANCNGKITVKMGSDTIIAKDVPIKANKITEVISTGINIGDNRFSTEFTPDKDYIPGKNKEMASLDVVTNSWNVVCKQVGTENGSIYVSPSGSGDGTYSNPMSITEAFHCVRPGQSIVLKEGTYNVSSTVRVDRGIDGTADKMIKMVADPNAKTRPVFDAGNKCTVMQIVGNYWYCSGFDITHSSNGSTGLILSGSYCVLDDINAYHNGNTGIAIARYDSGDEFDMWPSYNLVVNCTSYGNADLGYEDADGFAAKITNGVGNIFDNCIAYNNADDGWDLFAKVQTGIIGAVTIRNCVAYGNGYLEDGTNAGNGNGFKMGGDGLSGHHVLENSVAFNNKANGIDSNTCPDIIVRNCTSFNNGSSDIVISASATNTDFDVKGYIGFRNSAWLEKLTNNETINKRGNQDSNKIYRTDNYYWDGTKMAAVNSEGKSASADWFVNLDTKFDVNTHTFTEKVVTRNADNSINMNGLLVLTDKAPVDAGARMKACDIGKLNGFVCVDGTWGYYKDGEIDKTFCGYVENDGITYVVIRGKVDTRVTEMRYVGTELMYFVEGVQAVDYTGTAYYAKKDLWCYVTNGVFDNTYNGLCNNEDGSTFYMVNGVRKGINGLNNINSVWYYFVNGSMAYDYSGAVYYAPAKASYYVENGILDKTKSGLTYCAAKDCYYFLKKGQLDKAYNGLVYNSGDKKWYYFVEGGQAVDYTGLVYYETSQRYYYVANGVVDFTFNGVVMLDGVNHIVVGGKAK